MGGVAFNILNKSDSMEILISLFDILHENMSVIAPTGESYEDDKRLWISSIIDALQNPQRNIIVITFEAEIIGFFMCSISGDLFKMEEIQFKPQYQGKGVFKELYFYLFSLIADNVKYVEAFASKQNHKSQGILEHLGLKQVGENHNGRCFRYYGLYEDMKTKKYFNTSNSTLGSKNCD